MPAVMEKLENFTKEELIQRFVSTEFNRFLNYYGNSKQDLNAQSDNRNDDFRERGKRDDRNSRDFGDRKKPKRESKTDSNFQRFFVNLGRKDGFNHGALLRLVCDSTGMDKSGIGKIDILNNFSFFDAEKSEAPLILKKLHGLDFEGKTMSVEETNRGDQHDTGSRKKEFGAKREFKRKTTSSSSFREKNAAPRKRSYKN